MPAGRTATPIPPSFVVLDRLAAEIPRDAPGVVSVTYTIAPKPDFGFRISP
jgi:hypothetical protein